MTHLTKLVSYRLHTLLSFLLGLSFILPAFYFENKFYDRLILSFLPFLLSSLMYFFIKYLYLKDKFDQLSSFLKNNENLLNAEKEKLQKLQLDFKQKEDKLNQEILRLQNIQKGNESEKRMYFHILENAHYLIWTLAEDGKFKFINHACKRILGYKPEELVGIKTWSDLLHKDQSLDSETEHLNRVFGRSSARLNYSYKSRYLDTQGKEVYLIHHTKVSQFDIGGVKEVFGTSLDITDTVHYQQKVEEERERSTNAAKMASLGQIASGVAHEINTPLTTIMLATGQLRNLHSLSEDDTFKLENIIDTIEATIERIIKIIRGLKRFSRSSELDSFESVLVIELLEDTIGLCKKKFREKQIDFIFNTTEDLQDLRLHCKPVPISQVLINLINNAVDAIENLENKWIKIEVHEKFDFLELSITDSGHGIPVPIRKKIFEPFFTTKEVGKGTGLGISISSSIIKDHQGYFELDDKCRNTRFIVGIPLHKNSP